MANEIVIFITTSSLEEAEKIGKKLVEEKLVACVNIIPRVKSIFTWQEKICEEGESLLIIKTKEVLFDDILKKVKTLHSYTVPEVIALPIIKGLEDYLKWVREVTIAKEGHKD